MRFLYPQWRTGHGYRAQTIRPLRDFDRRLSIGSKHPYLRHTPLLQLSAQSILFQGTPLFHMVSCRVYYA